MKLLLIMPNFFDYPKEISTELAVMGYKVVYFDDRPSTNAVVKTIIRINKNLVSGYIARYFKKIKKNLEENKYDVVLVISGQSLSFTEEMIKEIRSIQESAKFVLYQWDSEKNFPYIKKMQKYFDKCYSFDRQDSKNNKNLIFLPLFYSKKYEEIGKKKQSNYKYDFSFIGTAHPKKYKFINMMSDQLKKFYPKQFIYFFFPSRLVYLYRKVVNEELRNAKYNEFHYVPMNGKDMEEVYTNSKCILDSPQSGQKGLTIRVIEALGAKKKLITTNEDVKNYDFYRSENVYIYNGSFDFSSSFFCAPYTEIEDDIYTKYSIRSWLNEILS